MRYNMLWLLPLVMLLGLRGLDADAIWYDEARTLYYSGIAHEGPVSLVETIQRAVDNPINPPVYYLLLNVWSALTGDTAFAGRALSLLLGMLAVVVIYRTGEDQAGPVVGFGAAVALGCSAFFIVYTHEMRNYALVMLASALVMLLYGRANRRGAARWVRGAFVLSLGLLLYTHYFAAFVAAGLGAYHVFFSRPGWRPWLVTLGLFALGGLLYTPWVPHMINGVLYYETDLTRQLLALTPTEALIALAQTFGNRNALLLALIFGYAVASWRQARLPLAVSAVAFGLVLSVNAATNVLTEMRYLVMLWPPLALTVGFGVGALARVGVPPAALLSLWILGGVWVSADADYYPAIMGPEWHMPWARIADFVREDVHAEDLLLVQLPDLSSTGMHADSARFHLADLPAEHGFLEIWRQDNASYAAQLDALVDGQPRVWLASSAVNRLDRRELLESVLDEKGYADCKIIERTDLLRLELFAQRDNPVTFDEGIMVTPLGLLNTVENALPLTAFWDISPEVPPFVYSVGWHITDEGGALVAQLDEAIPEPGEGCTWTTLDVGGLPPGEYDVNLLVYVFASGERLSGTRAGETGERLRVGRFSK